MRVRAVDPGEPEAERLRQHLGHPAGEVQRQEQAPLRQAFEPVLPAGGDQELQTRPVSLAGPPREPAYRHGQRRRRVREIAYRHDDVGLARLPHRRPRAQPVRIIAEPTHSLIRHGVRQEQLIEGAGMRPHRPDFGYGGVDQGTHVTSTPRPGGTNGEINGSRLISSGQRYPARESWPVEQLVCGAYPPCPMPPRARRPSGAAW